MSLELRSVCAGYGRAQVLFDVSLAVKPGEVLVLIGRNGAGKSTTMKAAMGLLAATAGKVLLDGQDITNKPTHRIAQAGLGFVPEERRIFTDLTVGENLAVGALANRAKPNGWSLDRVLTLFPKLREMLSRPGGQMSGGEQQMLTIARTLMGNPSTLLLDEPSEGLAPVIVERIVEAVLTLKKEGLGILLSEQNLHFAQLVADRATVIERGHIRFEGTMTALMQDDATRQRYLSV
jgi:branched-chain amino acid transport system ATP-binding protein